MTCVEDEAQARPNLTVGAKEVTINVKYTDPLTGRVTDESTRVDMSTDINGRLTLVETKASGTADYTPSQTMWMETVEKGGDLGDAYFTGENAQDMFEAFGIKDAPEQMSVNDVSKALAKQYNTDPTAANSIEGTVGPAPTDGAVTLYTMSPGSVDPLTAVNNYQMLEYNYGVDEADEWAKSAGVEITSSPPDDGVPSNVGDGGSGGEGEGEGGE